MIVLSRIQRQLFYRLTCVLILELIDCFQCIESLLSGKDPKRTRILWLERRLMEPVVDMFDLEKFGVIRILLLNSLGK